MKTNEIADVIIQSMSERQFNAFLTTYKRGAIHEADVFGVNKNDYMYEYEIKRSRGDFLAEFKNKTTKHRWLSERSAIRWYDKWVNGKRTDKKEMSIQIPNRYYFACSEGLISVGEVPEYAGLVYVTDVLTEVKNAPLLHKVKANEDIYRSIAGVLSQRSYYGCSYYTYKHNNKQHELERTE